MVLRLIEKREATREREPPPSSSTSSAVEMLLRSLYRRRSRRLVQTDLPSFLPVLQRVVDCRKLLVHRVHC